MQDSTTAQVTNLILCGGIGARLWPLSRPDMPKQFARILPGPSLFEQTVLRNRELCSKLAVAAGARQMELAREQLAGLGILQVNFLVEPLGRNTAPAIALYAFSAAADEILLVTPSDHVITDGKAYAAALSAAVRAAAAGYLVTFGIRPSYPETGFGYIQRGEQISGLQASGNAWRVASFREKPDAKTAQAYVASGNYFWNSGMFCFRAQTYLDQLKKHAPQVYAACKAAYQAATENNRADKASDKLLRPSYQQMAAIPAASIDYALMEHTDLAAVVPGDFAWSDLGSFEALHDFLPKDAAGNAAGSAASSDEDGATPPEFIDARGNLVHATGRRRVVLLDVEGLVLVETEDAILLTRRSASQRVKEAWGRDGESPTSKKI